MIRVVVDTVIKQPIGEVFNRLVNIDGYPEWLPQSRVFVDCQQISEGPVGLGTTFIDRTRAGIFQGEVTAFERPTNVAFRMRLRWLGLNVLESRPEYHLNPINGQTDLHMYAEGELYGIFKLMEGYVARIAEQERRRTVYALKQSLESSPS